MVPPVRCQSTIQTNPVLSASATNMRIVSRTITTSSSMELLFFLLIAENVHKLVDAVSDHVVFSRAVGNSADVFSCVPHLACNTDEFLVG